MALVDPPLQAKLPIQQLRTNDLLFINGVAQSGAFAVNLETRNKEIAFHFNPRFNERSVVRNTQSACGWGCDEHDGGFPFHECQPFDIVILVQDCHYKVTVNGAHFIDYKHRIPKEAICELIVKGDVQLQVVRYQPANHQCCLPAPCGQSASVCNPPLPYTGQIVGGFNHGRRIRIIGVARGNRFTINLQVGGHCGADVALAFDMRFNYLNEHNVVVRDSFINGRWENGVERDGPAFPFCLNAPFDIIIQADACGFKVMVNNKHYIDYKHRIPLASVDHLNIVGDGQIFMILDQ